MIYFSPIGPITITDDGQSITGISFASESSSNETLLARLCAQQLDEYFNGTRIIFDLPLCPKGTDFQKKVWNALMQVPYGKTASYSQIAEMIGNTRAARAVGMANHDNPIAIIIPCHRIVGKDGSMTGYAAGIDMKMKLLQMESNYCKIKSSEF